MTRYGLDVGGSILERARAVGARSIAVVGTSKNAGKSVTVAALCAALERTDTPFGLCSTGRDGETRDTVAHNPKPRFYLRPGTVLATPATLLPGYPALEILLASGERGALGPIFVGRVRVPGFYEVAGPSSASAVRRIAAALGDLVPAVLIDGAVDRLAAIRDDDAVIVAAGVGSGGIAVAVDDARALAARLSLPRFDSQCEHAIVDGPLSAAAAREMVSSGERRQVVVENPIDIAFGGRAFLNLAKHLDLRCRRPLRVIACTVAPSGPGGAFQPREFLEAVAAATGLPTYDVYARAEAA